MRWALLVAFLMHAAAVALLAAFGMPRQLAEDTDEPPGIIAVFSLGGGGEAPGPAMEPREGALPPSETVAEAPGEVPVEAPAPDAPPETVTAEAEPAERVPEPAVAPAPASASLPLPPPSPPDPPPPPREAARAAPATPPAARGEAAAPRGREGEAARAAPSAPSTAGLLLPAREATVGQRVEPIVPIEARMARMQGTVVLAVTISPDGIPTAVDVFRSSGHMLLDRAAQEALWQWRFDPARRGGVPVEDRIAIPFVFRIVN